MIKNSARSRLAGSVAVFGLAAVLAASVTTAATASEKVLHAFGGGTDGAIPNGGLIADSAGNLYGATEAGGSGTGCFGHSGCGTLFEIAKNGGETVLYSFQGGTDGIGPFGPLLVDDSGNLYGTTEGGAGNGCAGYGCGTVFKFAPDGTETVLYAFQGGTDGLYPQGSLIADQNGNLYGNTNEGGNYNGTACMDAGCGTVFEIQPNGGKITLHAFQGGTDGTFPVGGLIADASGNLYGMTGSGGGCSANSGGCGTVFKVTPGGTESVLYAFRGNSDGMFPLAGLIADSSGNLYGTTAFGGTFGGGTVFKVKPNGAETVLYSFKGGSDGANPEGGLVLDKKGNLYGTTLDGGGDGCRKSAYGGCGTVFALTPKGEETVLLAFRRTHGQNPAAALLQRKNGDLYGTTMAGGKSGYGVVFELKR